LSAASSTSVGQLKVKAGRHEDHDDHLPFMDSFADFDELAVVESLRLERRTVVLISDMGVVSRLVCRNGKGVKAAMAGIVRGPAR